jgi:hypothetical protein
MIRIPRGTGWAGSMATTGIRLKTHFSSFGLTPFAQMIVKEIRDGTW